MREHHIAAMFTLFGLLLLMVGPLIEGVVLCFVFERKQRDAIWVWAFGVAWAAAVGVTLGFTGYIQALTDWMNYGRI